MPQGEFCHGLRRGPVPRGHGGPDLRRGRCATRPGQTVMAAVLAVRAPRTTGTFKAGETVVGPHRLLDALRGRPVLAQPRRSRARATAPTSSTSARTSPRCSCTRTRSTGGLVDLEQVLRDRRARDERRTSAPAAPRRVQPRRVRRTWTLAWTLAVTEWKLRFYGSVLGYLWSLARPFALFGVIYLVFSEFAKLGDDVPHYAVYILFSIVLFQFFAEIAGRLGAVARRAREPAAQGALPTARDPALDRARRRCSTSA